MDTVLRDWLTVQAEPKSEISCCVYPMSTTYHLRRSHLTKRSHTIFQHGMIDEGTAISMFAAISAVPNVTPIAR